MKGLGDAGFTSVTHRTLACGSFLSVSRADSLKANHGNLQLLMDITPFHPLFFISVFYLSLSSLSFTLKIIDNINAVKNSRRVIISTILAFTFQSVIESMRNLI